MTGQHEPFEHDFSAALAAYLARSDELALSRAYELGRRALVDGLGVLDMVSLHNDVLGALLADVPDADRRDLVRSAFDFFRELMSPFDMTFRGYREANKELGKLIKRLKRQNEELERANDGLEAFSYSVSHDLRAPLRGISGFSNALMERCIEHLDAEGKRYLHIIQEAAQRMGHIIDDLLALARITRSELKRSDVDLSAVARRIADRLQNTTSIRQVEFRIDDTVHASGDLRLLTLVLENLLGNAWKYTSKRERTRIEFGQREHEGQTAYFVRDNGAGFDMTYAKKLFKAFQRLHSAEEFEGTGIGLAIVQRIVERHGGQVWAEGQVDGGAMFCFTLGTTEQREGS
jgi:light-regulated signal transduction histidine kinase (bacteriophytochrome)